MRPQVIRRLLVLLGMTGVIALVSGQPVFAAENFVFDHVLYGTVLQKYVRDGKVNYAALQKDRKGLDRYLLTLAHLPQADFDAMSEKEQIAFWVNAYNVFTLRVIIDHYPIKTRSLAGFDAPKNSIRQIPGAWDKIQNRVTGRDLTLNQIEHEILRKQYHEPRIHFALVCAAHSCPYLRNEPYTGARLDEQLDDQAKQFFGSSEKNRVDLEKHVIYLSPILRWFKEDFIKKAGSVRAFVRPYFPEAAAHYLSDDSYSISYTHYDWTLNDSLIGQK